MSSKDKENVKVFVHGDTGKIIENTCKLIDGNYIGTIIMDNDNAYSGTFVMYMTGKNYNLMLHGYGEREIKDKREKGYFDNHVLKFGYDPYSG
jgi:hypothetical protein